MKTKIDAKQAIRQIAMREGVSEEEVRKQMMQAMTEGMESGDPAIQAEWRRIPRRGSRPTPEELITYLATHLDG